MDSVYLSHQTETDVEISTEITIMIVDLHTYTSISFVSLSGNSALR